MWQLLQGIQEQVTRYSTWIGQLWYLCVFLFRLFVVVTIGGAVYGDEFGEFSCVSQEPGCKKMCFNVFSKMSHIRFWAFQLLAVTTPTVLFHFFSMGVTGRIAKKEAEEKKLREENQIDDGQYMMSAPPQSIEDCSKTMKKVEKLERRAKKIGNYKKKKVYSNKGELTEVPYTTAIHIAYYTSILMRMKLEGIFIYFGYQLFKFMDLSKSNEESGPMDFLSFKVPAMFKCEKGVDPAVDKACSQAMLAGDMVTCWISRPYEKTILIQYMNYLSGICFLLSAAELIYIPVQAVIKRRRKFGRVLGLNGNNRYPEQNMYVNNQYTTHTFSPAPSYRPPHRYQGNEIARSSGYANSVITESMGPPRMTHSDGISAIPMTAPSVRSVITSPPTMNNIARHNQTHLEATGAPSY